MGNIQIIHSKTEPKSIGGHGDVWMNYEISERQYN
jgi:hypothetical protein